MRRLRRTKIVATLGPASSTAAMIAALFEAGADVFRINMSHTPPGSSMRELVATIRNVETELRPPDRHSGRSAGPEAAARHRSPAVRSQLKNGDDLHARFQSSRRATPTASICRIRKFSQRCRPGHTLLLDDGKVRLIVHRRRKRDA